MFAWVFWWFVVVVGVVGGLEVGLVVGRDVVWSVVVGGVEDVVLVGCIDATGNVFQNFSNTPTAKITFPIQCCQISTFDQLH